MRSIHHRLRCDGYCRRRLSIAWWSLCRFSTALHMCQTCHSSEIGFPKDTHCRGGREKCGVVWWKWQLFGETDILERAKQFKWMKRNFLFCSMEFLIKKKSLTWTPETTEQGFGYTAASKQHVFITSINAHTQPLHADSVTLIINYSVSVVIIRSKEQPWLWSQSESKLTKTATYVSSYVSCSHQYYSWNHNTTKSFPTDQRKRKRFPKKHTKNIWLN